MKTPTGKECRYFFGDYYRGRHREECRLLLAATPPLAWLSEYCVTCPVPDILLANSCENMELSAQLNRPFPYIKRQVRVNAFCIKSKRYVTEPHIGCGECHQLPFSLPGDSLDTDPTD